MKKEVVRKVVSALCVSVFGLCILWRFLYLQDLYHRMHRMKTQKNGFSDTLVSQVSCYLCYDWL